jgi:hypothetical protein
MFRIGEPWRLDSLSLLQMENASICSKREHLIHNNLLDAMRTNHQHCYALKLTTSEMSFTVIQVLPVFCESYHNPFTACVYLLSEWLCLYIAAPNRLTGSLNIEHESRHNHILSLPVSTVGATPVPAPPP